MYTISKGPSKLVAQRRTGPPQQQVDGRLGELLKCRPPCAPLPSGPRPGRGGRPAHCLLPFLHSAGPRLVFQRVAGRRAPGEGGQEPYTPAHQENVRFVSEAWQQVQRQLAGERGPRPVQYVERSPNPRLQGFVPIDLDEWWAQQFLARVTSCS
ncbi:MAPK regulated corepressor interacting protein 2 isoform X1 [Ochotona curzoniae]|uniref:MAPK regulated corepressor interacting protein 2 isoform X1 n=1 Tax=Ochotona curzoniae TaxID=130825 RepID=UPI001B350E8D|nr:MAPK regulated corepressor interacting protein 2 isoform X1 [Ochotona curzoniae]